MARRLRRAGHRQTVIAHAWLCYHAGQIDRAALARCLEQFRRASHHTR